MNRLKMGFSAIIFCFILLLLASCCKNQTSSTTEAKVYMNEYCTLEDFESIVIGESNIQDVDDIVYTEYMYLTSYGGFCDYPTQDGGYIRIKFYGKDLIVGSIEEKTGDGLREP